MSTDNTTYHIPVLLEAAVSELDIRPDGTYCDLTFGGGGHSRHILSNKAPLRLRRSNPLFF